MKKSFFTTIVVLSFVLFIITGSCFAQALNSIGFLSGYMSGDLKKADDYEVIPLMLSFGFDARPFFEKLGIHSEGILEFQVEPFLSPVLGPESNLEAGVNLLFKYAFPLHQNFMPYIKVGSGPSYMTLHTYEQSTQFNFVTSGCAGFSWFIKDDVSIDCEYRYRHLSNCSIDEPNSGINTQAVLLGCTFLL